MPDCGSGGYFAIAAVLLGLTPVPLAAAGPAPLRFNRDVRPVLSEKCFACHGPDRNARKGNLRLDQREAAVAAGVIQPGDVKGSRLAARIRPVKPALQMPPPGSGKALTEAEKTLLERWIAEGAEYEPHWAYLPPERPRAPAGPAGIDTLIGQKLAQLGLDPVGRADRRTLARRLSFDLTGLPPSPDEVAAFEQDQDVRAYEKLVDRLLESPQFGERMAVYWLDLVRYADSVGYHSDVPMPVSPYRDYVIAAFNDNLPFDQFTREQIAGDLLPSPTLRQLAASAYNRLNRKTNEGGAQEKEYRAKYAADRVRTTATVWLGSTLGCAECHDHKFDPFLTKDFYRFAAFFADLEERGVYRGHGDLGARVRVPDEQGLRNLAALDREAARLEKEGAGKLADTPAGLAAYLSQIQDDAGRWQVLKVRKASAREKSKLRKLKDGSLRLEAKEPPKTDVHTAELSLPKGRWTGLRLEAMRDESTGGKFSLHDEGDFLLNDWKVELVNKGRAAGIPVAVALADSEKYGFPVREALDENDHSGWSPDGDPAASDRQAILVFAEPVEAKRRLTLRVTLSYTSNQAKKVLGRFRLSASEAAFPDLVPEGAVGAAVTAGATPSESELRTAFERATKGNANWLALRKLARDRQAILDAGDPCLISHSVEPREVRILPRGNWMDDSGDLLSPATPEFLGGAAAGRPLTRLDLAGWLVNRQNPLTARVFVNRMWKLLFGAGIVKNLDDVGSQAETPRNPELLDWLAVEFMESGWDVKKLIRTMVLSEAYQRSSEPAPALKEKDPYNRYYARQSATRLDAEFVRDSALKVSGLLNSRRGGPSAKPYQPAGYYRELNFPKREYQADYNDNQYRRGVYTHWQRTFTHPSLQAFDAPSREECAAERPVSNTPLQSLVLLNDPTYVEASRALAMRMLEAAANPAARVDFAFRQAFDRPASAQERSILEALAVSQAKAFEQDKRGAAEFLRVGMKRPSAQADPVELAAWTEVARAILNKHEFLMRY